MKKFISYEGVHIRSDNTTDKMMKHLLIALLPIILFHFYKNGIMPFMNGKSSFGEMLYPIFFILTGILFSLIFEAIYAKIIVKSNNIKEHLKNSYALFPGLFLSLILPIKFPLHLLILGVFIGVVIGKMIFGGFGKNIINPALLGYLALVLLFPMMFSNNNYKNNYELDTISSSTPLTNFAAVDNFASYEEVVSPYGGLLDLFVGFKPGNAAEVSILLCLLALIYLSFFKVIKIKIPIIYITTVFVMLMLIGVINNIGIWFPFFGIFTGALFFGAIFMATDPVTSPVTNIGQIVFALLLGIITVSFRFLSIYPEGVMYSIVIANLLVFILDRIGAISRFDIKKSIAIILLMILIGLGMVMFISSKMEIPTSTEVDPNYNIISVTDENNVINYVVTQKGWYEVKAKITLDRQGKVIKIIILEIKDEYYDMVKKENYIDKIIDNQDNLDNLDTISGATRTSGGFKKMVTNTVSDYLNSIDNEGGN